MVVDTAGSVFLSQITRVPQHIDALTSAIASCFTDIDEDTVRQDATAFFDRFVEDGFLVRGETPEETLRNIEGFTYETSNPNKPIKNCASDRSENNPDSQDFLESYFLSNPQLMSFQMELTSRCNERCVHCYIPHELKEGDIVPELFYNVLDQLQDMGTWHLTLSGGEPMLHPHFKEFLAAAKERDFFVSILSNLTLLDDETVNIMKLDNVSSVQVSLYSMNPKHHDAITQLPGSFEKTVAAIEKLIAHDIPVQISCPTMKGNKNDFGEVLRWAHDHKIRATTDYIIMARYNHDTSNLAHRLTPDECGEVMRDVLAWDIDYQERVISTSFKSCAKDFDTENDKPLCGVGISTCCMVSNGNVYPCSGWQTYVCGNLKLTPLKDIWTGADKMGALRAVRRSAMEPCLDCNKRAFCSPCMVRNANESPTGDPFEINPYFCEVAQVNKDIVTAWKNNHLKLS